MKSGVKSGTRRGTYISKTAMTFEEIEAQLGISGSRASQLFHSGVRKIKSSKLRPVPSLIKES